MAFSCKARYFCPSCHQKRMLAYGEWVEENVLAPVPHRQYVFALPKLLRPYFRQRRERLGTLCQIIVDLLYQGFKAMAPQGRSGFILYVQTFGDLVTFNPHVHALVADGVFYPAGTFRVLPPIPEGALTEGLRHRVLDFLCEEAGFDPRLAERMRNWQHSGFSMHNQIRVKAHDAEGRKQLACYMIRTPFALEKMTYDKNTGMVIYRSKLHATLKRNFQLLPGTKWLTLLLTHIPDRYEHLVRYYGWYSNRARGARNAEASTAESATTLHLDETPFDRQSKSNWARLIQKVYEVDPLECPQCGNTMRIIAVIDDPATIRKILKHPVGSETERTGPPRPRPALAGEYDHPSDVSPCPGYRLNTRARTTHIFIPPDPSAHARDSGLQLCERQSRPRYALLARRFLTGNPARR